jgi:hypothetical protein
MARTRSINDLQGDDVPEGSNRRAEAPPLPPSRMSEQMIAQALQTLAETQRAQQEMLRELV